MDNVSTMKAPQGAKQIPLTGAVLVAFFTGDDAAKVSEKVAKAEASRIKYLARFFDNSTVGDVREAVKDMKKDRPDAEKKTWITRGAEVFALYGAYTRGFTGDSLGYHAAVAEARRILKDAGIRWDGRPILDKIAKEVRKDARTNAAIFEEVETVKRRAEAAGKPLTDEQVEEIRERASEDLKHADAKKLAEAIIKRKGAQFAGWLIEALENALAAAYDEEQSKQEQPQSAEQNPEPEKTGTEG